MSRRASVSVLCLALGLWVSGSVTRAQTLSIDDVRRLEGNGGAAATLFQFTVTLSAPSGVAVQVDWGTVDGTAVAGPLGTGDFAADSGTVSLPAGSTSKPVNVLVHGDVAVEMDELFYVDLTGATGAPVARRRGVGSILDDDTVRPGVRGFGIVADGDAAEGRNRLQWYVPGGADTAVGVVARYTEGATCSPPTAVTAGTSLPVAPPVADSTQLVTHPALVLDREYCYSVWLDYGGGNYSARSERKARPFDATGPVKWKYFIGTTTLAAPTVGLDAVIVPSNDGYIHAMQRSPAATGIWPTLPWRPPNLGSAAQQRSPVVPLAGGSRAFVSTQDGRVHAVDTANGNVLWSTLLPGGAAQGAPAGIFTAFGGAYDYILVGTSAATAFNRLYALDPFTGTVIDSFPQAADGYQGQVGAILGMPTVDYNLRQVYFASVARGPTIWCVALGSAPDALRPSWSPISSADIQGSVVLLGGRVYAGTVGNAGSGIGQVFSVNAVDGTDYSANLDGAVQGFLFPDRRNNDLYAATHGLTQDRVEAITDTGLLAPKWAIEPVLTAPSTVLHHPGTDDIYVGVRDDYPGAGDGAAVLKLDASTGAVVGSVSLESTAQTIGAPTLDIGYGMLYVGSEAGIIYAVELGF